MFTIDEKYWTVAASLAQVLLASFALIISFVAMVQKKRIEELTDITIELSKQTKQLAIQAEIMNKRYELEADIDLYKKIPNFRIVDFSFSQGGAISSCTFTIINMGAIALDVFKINSNPYGGMAIMNVDTDQNFVHTGQSIQIRVNHTFRSEDGEFIGHVFTLKFKDNFGRTFGQDLTTAPFTWPLNISNPKLISIE